MQQELKDAWVAALRSGDYKQGIGCLRSPLLDSYCCVGVLAAVMNPGVEVPRFTVPTPTGFKNPWDALEPRDQSKLISMNDWQEKSFDQIADWIEENVESS